MGVELTKWALEVKLGTWAEAAPGPFALLRHIALRSLRGTQNFSLFGSGVNISHLKTLSIDSLVWYEKIGITGSSSNITITYLFRV